MSTSSLPVAVIGAGPVGLAAAAHLLEKGEEPILFEAGDRVADGVRSWGHVRFFSPWRYVVDRAAAKLLEPTGWLAPDPDEFPTGDEMVDRYLGPLAATAEIRSRLRLGHRVVSVARDGFDKMKTDGREHAPFVLTVQTAEGIEETFLAKAVVDASGTIERPNPLGAGGTPAIGERANADRIAYGMPDVLGGARDRYAGRRVLVVGSGHSAFNVLLDLVELADQAPGTEIVWAVRRQANRLQNLFGGGINDALPARGELGRRVQGLVETGRLRMVTGFRAARVTDTPEGLIVAGQDEVLPPVDEIVVATGYRPDLSMLSELRLGLDPAVESPSALAPLIDPNVHSCGSVPPHGAEELRHPEADVYIVGMKSYGRAPTFLMLTGYEQVRSVACAIAGDWEGARDVQLVLPETGVCSSGIVLADRGVSCCSSGSAVVEDVPAACCGAASVASAPSACCGESVPRVIQLTAAAKGGCCG